MTRRITLTIEATDQEVENLLARFGGSDGRQVQVGVTGAATGGTNDDDGDGDGPVNTGDRDSAGIPWISGIHASTKSTNKDGTWRSAKGVSNEQRAAAEAPHKTAGAAPASAPGFTLPGGAPAAAASVPAMPGFAPPGGGLPGFTPPGAIPTPAPPPAPVTYEAVVSKYQELANAGKVTPDSAAALYAAAGITTADQLQNDETARRRLMDEFAKLA